MTSLPDCRAYEQVSPVSKNGADALGYETNVRASVSGERVTFASYGGFADAEGLKTFAPYLASRGAQGWSTSALYPRQEVKGNEFRELTSAPLGYDAELRNAVLALTGPQPPGAAGAQPGTDNLYARNLDTRTYSLLTSVGVTNVTLIGFAAGSSDFSHLLFESPAKLTPEAPIDNVNVGAAGPINLYESVNGQVRLVGVLPDGRPAPEGARAGASVNISGGAVDYSYTQNTISQDGSRIFWTDEATNQLYVRINGTTTVHVSASQRSEPDPSGPRAAFFRAATPNGEKVFFTSEEKLTNDSTAHQGHLYLYNTRTGTLKDLSVAQGGSANVIGVLGTSEDGTSAYFAATGAPLAAGAPSEAEQTSQNIVPIYDWQEGQTTYVASVNEGGNNPGEDPNDWTAVQPTGSQKQARVTPSGHDLLFASTRQITSYDNRGLEEFYRYDSISRSLTCVSCNPTGEPATNGAAIGEGAPNGQATIFKLSPILTNVMSEDGSRVFFQTAESLVPGDTNGRTDVYEWNDGQLNLISSGHSAGDSYLGDASPTGNDVFFTTRESLVGQDQDANVDMYDARIGGGISAQFPAIPSPPCTGDTCRSATSQPPPPEPAMSATFNGVGNLAPSPPQATLKPLTKGQELRRALSACRRQRKSRRQSCERAARRRYGARHSTHHARRAIVTTRSTRTK